MGRLKLSPSASVTPTDVGVLLRSDLGTFQLDGPDVALFVNRIVPLLDGSRDADAVAGQLDGYSRASVLAFLQLLEQSGLIETSSDLSETAAFDDAYLYSQREFFNKWLERPETALERLRDSRVLVVGLEPWGVVCASELAAAGVGNLHLVDDRLVAIDDIRAPGTLKRSHLEQPRSAAVLAGLKEDYPGCQITAGDSVSNLDLQPGDGKWDLVVATVTADDLVLLNNIAHFAHAANIRTVHGVVDGLNALVGPVVVPGESACWNCYRLRELANAEPAETAHALQASLLTNRPPSRSRILLSPMMSLLGQLVSLEALKLLSGYAASILVGRVLVQHLITLETSLHSVIRMPWCEVCGGVSSGGNKPSGGLVDPDQKTPGQGAKSLSGINDPEELRRTLAGWVDERTGIVKYLMMNTADANEPETPLTSSALLSSYTEGAYRGEHSPEVGSGKGMTITEAMIGAVGEAIERYSAARYRKEEMHRSSFDELRESCFDPRRLCLYEEAQYEDPEFPFVRFDPARPIDWTMGHWLHDGSAVWLPALPSYFNFHVCRAEQFCQVTSNGLAAGANLEDASLRAVLELVERDAFMITWLTQRPGQRIFPDDSLEPGLNEVIRQLDERGAKVELYFVNAGIPIPVVACLAFGDGESWPGVTVALASHLDPRAAVRKAILEQGHVGPYIRRLMLDKDQPRPDTADEVRTLTDHALYYVPPERNKAFDFLRSSNAEPVKCAQLEEAGDISLSACVNKLNTAGIRVAIADVTSPDVAQGPFRVARALGVDVQPIDFGFKLRRLSNQRLAAMQHAGLNPEPHPLA